MTRWGATGYAVLRWNLAATRSVIFGMKSLVVLVAVVGLAACSAGHNTSSSPPSTTSRTSRPPVRRIPSPRPRLATRIELPFASIVAGATVTGHLVVDNKPGKPLQLVSSHSSYPGFAVALGNDTIPPEAAFGASCTTGEAFVIPVGESRYVFSVRASYFGCSNTGRPQGTVPECLPGGRNVPLPVGEYRATFIDNGTHLPHPAPVPVRVVETG